MKGQVLEANAPPVPVTAGGRTARNATELSAVVAIAVLHPNAMHPRGVVKHKLVSVLTCEKTHQHPDERS